MGIAPDLCRAVPTVQTQVSALAKATWHQLRPSMDPPTAKEAKSRETKSFTQDHPARKGEGTDVGLSRDTTTGVTSLPKTLEYRPSPLLGPGRPSSGPPCSSPAGRWLPLTALGPQAHSRSGSARLPARGHYFKHFTSTSSQLTMTLQGRCYQDPCLTVEETEAQRGHADGEAWRWDLAPGPTVPSPGGSNARP